MRLRTFALVVALFVAATPVVGVVCEMDCDPPPAASGCHTSSASLDGSAVREARHACDHDHTTISPALLAPASARDAVSTLADLPVAMLAHASIHDARVATAAMHGPPGASGPRTPTRVTVLRI